MKLVWTQEAITRLENIQHHLAVKEKSPDAALAMTTRLVTRVPHILDAPLAGRIVPDYEDEQVREIQENPYRIVYYVTDDIVYILTVLHHRQLIPQYKKMLANLRGHYR